MAEPRKLALIAPRPSPAPAVNIATTPTHAISPIANQSAHVVIRLLTLPMVATVGGRQGQQMATTPATATVSFVQLPATGSPVKASEHNSWQSSPCLSPTGGSRPLGTNDVLLGAAAALDSSSSGPALFSNPASSSPRSLSFSAYPDVAGASGNFPFKTQDDSHSSAQQTQKTDRKLVCPFCSREFKRSFSHQVHVRRHTGQRPYQCTICGRAFTQNANVKRHVETHRIWPHQAAKSVTSMSNNREVDDGRFVVAETEQPSGSTSVQLMTACSYCDQTFSDSKALKKHSTTSHKDEKMFQCPQRDCRQLISALTEYLAHLKSHEGQMTYRCPFCDKRYSSLRDVGVHQHTHVFDQTRLTTVKNRSYQCFTCGDTFKTLESLERHETHVSHSYKCPVCVRVYCSRRALKRHFASHSHDFRFKCSQCDAAFAFKSILTNHEKTHKEASFACKRCTKKFKRRDMLQRHLTSVHSARPVFICVFSNCLRQFRRRDRLRDHVKLHTGVAAASAVTCDACGQQLSCFDTVKPG
uniref:C2H2-type domain-containing protein n=1 Tax=Plectus sambesii TaxID=2011161 RepID=A0A914VWQ6_9BILA